MPAVSKRQFRFMTMMKNNPEKMKNKPSGLSSEQAGEYISKNTGGSSYGSLPEEKKKKKGNPY